MNSDFSLFKYFDRHAIYCNYRVLKGVKNLDDNVLKSKVFAFRVSSSSFIYNEMWKGMETAKVFLKRGTDVNIVRDHLREVYRTQWNIPFKRDVFSHFSNTMILGSGDMGLWGRGYMNQANVNEDPLDCLLRKMAMELFLEYQYALIDPLEAVPRPVKKETKREEYDNFAAFSLFGSVAVR